MSTILGVSSANIASFNGRAKPFTFFGVEFADAEPPASGNGVMMALIFGDYFAQGGPGGGGGTMIAMIFS